MSTKNSKKDKCVDCNGTGKVTEVHQKKLGQPKATPPDCPACGGTGRARKSKQP